MNLYLTERLKHNKQFDWQEWFITSITKRHITERRTEELISQIDLFKKAKVLDVGCSFGYTCCLIAKKGARAYGDDINESLLEVAQELAETNRLKVDFFRANAKRLPFPKETFDIVICSELIEHVVNWEKVVREITRVAKGDAQIIISTPNLQGLATIKILLAKLRLLPIIGYERFLSPEEIRNQLKKNELRINREKRINLAFSYLPDCLYSLSLWLERLTQPIEKRWGGTIIFSCQKIASVSEGVQGEVDNLDEVLICPSCLGRVKREKENIICLVLS